MKRHFSRQELYDLVWSMPISKIAADLRISDRGIAKKCGTHQIPVPGRGYWARLEAGQKPKKTPLWKIDNPYLESVFLAEALDPAAAEALAEAQRALKQRLAAQDEAVRQKRKPLGDAPEIKTPRHKLHPSLSEFERELRSAKADRLGGIDVQWVKVPIMLIPRTMAFLNSLAFALEPYGIRFDGSSSRAAFTDNVASVGFEITSPRKRIVITSERGWSHSDYEYVDRLAFEIYGRAGGIRKKWDDKEHGTIEAHLAKIIESYRVNLEIQRKSDQEQRKAQKRHEHRARRRELAKLREEREDHRAEFFEALAGARREAAGLRSTIDLMPSASDASPDVQRMLAWAKARLDSLEADTTVDAIQSKLKEEKLFPFPDELEDPGPSADDNEDD